MKAIKILAFVALILFGAFMVVFGEADDSPGLQGLGVITAITGCWYLFKVARVK